MATDSSILAWITDRGGWWALKELDTTEHACTHGKDSESSCLHYAAATLYRGQEEKGTTKNEMVGWHHRLNGHGFGWAPGVSDGQGGLACRGSWGCKESDMTE